MNGKNVCVFSGIVGKNVKVLGANQNVTKFSIGIGRDQKKNEDGTWSGFTDWVTCVYFGTDPEIKEKALIEVYGSFRNNNWEKDGVKHYDSQIVVNMHRVFIKKNQTQQPNSKPSDVPPVQGFPDEDAPSPEFPDE